MPIGSFLWDTDTNIFARSARRILGTIDFHSHLRINPLLHWFRAWVTQQNHPISILEVGCGEGINLIELGRISRVNGTGYDINCSAIASAQRMARKYSNNSDLRFYCADVTNERGAEALYDAILLMDVVEHIQHPDMAIKNLSAMLRQGGEFVVSVPTPLYPRIFGREWHNTIGHLVDGYNIEQLDRIMAGHRRIAVQYSTGPLTWLACAFYYRWAIDIEDGFLKRFLGYCLTPFRFLDLVNGPALSASLFAVYRKESS